MRILQLKWGVRDWNRVERFETSSRRMTLLPNRWNFRPQQPVVMVHPGETALAFYTARNPTEKWVRHRSEVAQWRPSSQSILNNIFPLRPIDGISTYNVIPFEAGDFFINYFTICCLWANILTICCLQANTSTKSSVFVSKNRGLTLVKR